MDYWRREQLGVSSGIAAVALFGAGAIVAGTTSFPAATDGANEIAAFMGEHRTRLLVETFLGGLGLVAGLWFLGSLRSVLRRAEGGTGRVAGIAYGGGIAAGTLVAVVMVLLASVVYSVGINEAAITGAVWRAATVALAFVGFPMTVLIGATTLIVLRTGALPRAYVYLSAVPIVANVLGTISIFVESGTLAPGGFLAYYAPFGGTMLWLLGTSVVLTMTLGAPVETAVARRRITDVSAEPPRAARG